MWGQLGPEAGLPMATWGLTGCPGQRSASKASSSSHGSRRRPAAFRKQPAPSRQMAGGPLAQPSGPDGGLGTRWDVAAAATGSPLPAKASEPWRGEHGSSHGALPCFRPHTQSPGRATLWGPHLGTAFQKPASPPGPAPPCPAACCPRAEEPCLSRSPDTEEPPSGLSIASRTSRGPEE